MLPEPPLFIARQPAVPRPQASLMRTPNRAGWQGAEVLQGRGRCAVLVVSRWVWLGGPLFNS
jgi:hypothetical protein